MSVEYDHPAELLSAGASRRTFLRAAAISAAGAALAACAPRAAGDVQTKVLRVAWGGAPATLDPLTASADVEIAFLNAVYDYLIDVDSQSNLVPRLATDWAVSDDGLIYTLTIAEGVKFHDGSDLTLGDILWTFDRLQSDGPTADLYARVASVESGEGNTIIFKLTEPNPDFLYDLSDNHAFILKADALNIGEEFNGTGPFKLEEYTLEDRAIFKANPDYFGGAPGLDLEFIFFADAEAAANALRDGSVDMLLRMDTPTFQAFAGQEGFQAINIPTNGHDLIRLRADRGPGQNELVRQAFKHATNRQEIFEQVQLGYGAVGRDTPIGPLYGPFYTEDIPLPEHDPQKARDLLTQAGYPDGLEMKLYVPNSGSRPDLAQKLAAQWAEAGINVTIELQEEAQYYADDGWLEVDLGITGWGSRPTPQFYLNVAYKTGAQWNEAHFSDPELDDLIDQAAVTVDEVERAAIYRDIQRVLIERGPVLIPYFFAQFGVYAAGVSGVNLHPFAGRTRFDGATTA